MRDKLVEKHLYPFVEFTKFLHNAKGSMKGKEIAGIAQNAPPGQGMG